MASNPSAVGVLTGLLLWSAHGHWFCSEATTVHEEVLRRAGATVVGAEEQHHLGRTRRRGPVEAERPYQSDWLSEVREKGAENYYPPMEP